MPGYKGHIVGGIGAFSLTLMFISKSYPPTHATALQWFFVTILGALFPDIDIKSKGQGIFYRIIFLSLVLFYCKKDWKLFTATSFIALLPVLVRHRGIFHKTWFVVAVPFVLAYTAAASFPAYKTMFLINATFFAVGALSHLFLDRMS